MHYYYFYFKDRYLISQKLFQLVFLLRFADIQSQTSPSEINPSEPSIGFQFLHSSAKVCLSYNGSLIRIYYNQLSHVHLILQDFAGKYSGQLTLHGSGLKAITRAIYKAIQTYEEKVCVLSKVKVGVRSKMCRFFKF